MVTRVLKNPVYAGLIASADDLFPGEHRALPRRRRAPRDQLARIAVRAVQEPGVRHVREHTLAQQHLGPA